MRISDWSSDVCSSDLLVVEAMRLRAPGRLLAKMIGNVLFDALLGIVPVLGDLADFVFKSNRRHLQLLDAHLGEQLGVMEPATPRHRGRWPLLAVILVLTGSSEEHTSEHQQLMRPSF